MTTRTPLEDRIAAMVAGVVDDIRQKVVEEPWFGRPVTEKIADIHGALDQVQAQGKEQDMTRFYSQDQAPEQAQERDYGVER